MKTKVVNDTNHEVTIREGNAGIFRYIIGVPPGGHFTISLDLNATYCEYLFSTEKETGGDTRALIFSSDDINDALEITTYETVEQGLVAWRISKARVSPSFSEPSSSHSTSSEPQRPSINIENKALFDKLKGNASARIRDIEKSCAILRKFLNQVKVCPAQCNHLVKACSEGTKLVKDTYSSVSEIDMWQLFNSKKLVRLVNSLYRLLSALESTKVLLQDCGSQWYSIGLVLCIPLPSPGKNPLPLPSHEENPSPCLEEENPSPCLEEENPSPCHEEENPSPSPEKIKTHSKFDHLLKELSWNLDTIHYALQLSNDMELKWNKDKGRYLLERYNVPVLKSAELGPAESEELVEKDRKRLLSHLQDELPSAPKNFICQWAGNFIFKYAANRLRDDSIAAVLIDRLEPKRSTSGLQTSMNREPGGGSAIKLQADISIQPTPKRHLLVPSCFRIHLKDLTLRKKLSGPSESKFVYKGTWCGLQVAIRILRGTNEAVVDKEAAVMLRVQHPNIVDFYGCAFTNNAPAGPASGHSAGYVVMELAQQDLRQLIDQQNKVRSSGSFHLAVAIDILLQIVGAMIHMHNCGVTHRDLKAQNCLVFSRSSSHSVKSPDVPDLWTVKLIDFELSKELDSAIDDHTCNTGTRRWTAPEVWGPKGAGLAPYKPKCADVYSFGMVCYEVITGLLPFELDGYVLDSELHKALCEGKRPKFPASVSCPEGLKEIMEHCWVAEDKRSDFRDIQEALWEIKFDLEKQ